MNDAAGQTDEKPVNPIRPTDNDARALARRRVRSARFGGLAVLDPSDQAPIASRVALATQMDGAPVMLISELSHHTRSLKADPRCSLLAGEPGKGDPLAHPRITLIGRAEPIVRDDPLYPHVRRRYLMRHPKAKLYVDFGDFAFWRVEVARASLNGGFGKAYEMSADDVLIRNSELDAFQDLERSAIAHMHDDHLDAVRLYAEKLARAGAGDWYLSSLDPEGLDFVDGDRVARLAFDTPLERPKDLRAALVDLAKRARDGA